MKKLILFLLVSIPLFAQVTPPSGYTQHYKLRMWSQGARPSADSLNQNWKDIDSLLYIVNTFQVDTNRVAYKDKDNIFTGTNTFNDILSSYQKTDLRGITTIGDTLILDNEIITAESGNYYILNFSQPVVLFDNQEYDTVSVYGLKAPYSTGQIVTIIPLSRAVVRFVNNHTGPGTKMILDNMQDAYIGQFGQITFMAVQYQTTTVWIELSRSVGDKP